MCDLTTYTTVQDLCAESIARGAMFTAFDFSLEAKRRGFTERHRHMKHAVHDYFDSGAMGPEYTRTLIAIPGADAPAWLYHRWEDDIQDYQPVDRSSLQKTLPSQSQRKTVRERPHLRPMDDEAREPICPRCARGSLARLLVSRVLRWF
jgi:hypothetical protein